MSAKVLFPRSKGYLLNAFVLYLPTRGLSLQHADCASDRNVFLSGYSYLAIVITLPERFQIVNSDSSLMAGLHLLPMLGATSLGSIIGGVVSKTNNNTSRTLVAASCFQILGLGLLTTFDSPSSPLAPQFAYQSIFGLGVGLTFSSATILTKIQAAGRDHAVAQGVIAQVRVLGGAVGLVMCNMIFNIRLESVPLSSAEARNALHRSPLALVKQGGPDAEAVKTVFSDSFQTMVWVMFWVAVASFVASLCTWEMEPTPLHKLDEAAAMGRGPGHKQLGSRGGSDTELEDMPGNLCTATNTFSGEDRPGTPAPRVFPGSRL